MGFVFQHYALFRHMTVFDNVAYGLKVRPRKSRPSKQQIKDKVMELLQLVKLENFSDRYQHSSQVGNDNVSHWQERLL